MKEAIREQFSGMSGMNEGGDGLSGSVSKQVDVWATLVEQASGGGESQIDKSGMHQLAADAVSGVTEREVESLFSQKEWNDGIDSEEARRRISHLATGTGGETTYTQKAGYQRGSIPDAVDAEKIARGAEKATEKMESVSTINGRLQKKGVSRRYVVHESDAPDSVMLKEDDFGKYYFKTQGTLTRKDAVMHSDSKSWFGLNEDGRYLAVVKMLEERYPHAIRDIEDPDHAESFIRRAVRDKTDTRREDEDAFSLDDVDEVAELVASA